MRKKGIDVSVWQGNIDWAKVKAAGIEFAILRCGYGQDQTDQDDSKFKRNADECTRLGIPFGVYLYSYAKSASMAKGEANHALRLLKGYKPEYGVWYDLEDEVQASFSAKQLGDIAVTFCEALENAGYYVGIYANLNWLTTKLTDSRLKAYDKWVAQWSDVCAYTGEYGIWQYTSKGSVNGISGNVDMNIAYKDYPKIMRDAGLCGFKKNDKPAENPVSGLKVGDKVKIIKAGNGSAYGGAGTAGGIGWVRKVLKIYDGADFPYQVGDDSGTTGFYKADALKKQ